MFMVLLHHRWIGQPEWNSIMDVLCAPPEVVDHDGRLYLLVDLVHYLPASFARELEAAGPQTAQAFWNDVVLRWPFAAEQAVDAVDRDWDW